MEVQENEIQISEPKIISDNVIEAFDKNPGEKQKVLIGVSFPTVLYPEHSFSSEGYTDELGKNYIYVNGELIDEFQPNGSLVGCSTSRFNNYETVTFDPSVTGTYRVRVSKYALRDLNSKFYIGLRAISMN